VSKQQLHSSKEDLYCMMDAAHEYWEDLEDGAWEAVIKDAIDGFNFMNKTEFDRDEAFCDWFESRSEEKET